MTIMTTTTMMMFCPTCEESIPQATTQQQQQQHHLLHQDGICMTCGDRLISQQQQQQQASGSGGGGDDYMAAILAADASGSNSSLSTILAASELSPSISALLDNPMATATAAANDANNTTSTAHHRPASQKSLDNLKREVLTAKSAELLETRVELFTPCKINSTDFSTSTQSLTRMGRQQQEQQRLTFDAIPAEFTTNAIITRDENHHHNHHHRTMNPTTTTTTTTAALVLCTPRTTKGGQLSSQTLSEIAFLRKYGIPFIAYVTRGDNVTFVQKALVCQRAGMVTTTTTTTTSSSSQEQPNSNSSSSTSSSSSRCIGVIVGNATTGSNSNSHEVWPYIMQDTKKEAQQFGLTVPVVMIRQDDGRRLVQWAKSTPPPPTTTTFLTPQSNNKPNNDNDDNHSYYTTPCRIILRNKDSDESNSCPVCADTFAIGDTVVRLPNCGHVFHEACALAWLTRHNTCPYCRSELPTEDEEYERERLRRRRNAMMEEDGVNGHGSSFYG